MRVRRVWRAVAAAAVVVASAAIVAPVAAGKSRGPALLGFNDAVVAGANGVPTEEFVRLVENIDGNAIRNNIDWRHAEPRRDVWDERWWAHWRLLYDAALRAKITPIFVIGSAPAWAQHPLGLTCAKFGECENPPSHQMNDEWAEYAGEVARRFPAAMIEVWNEPNTRDFWRSRPNPERFAELLDIAHRAIKSRSPETKVISGGLLNVRRSNARGDLSTSEFLARAFAASPSMAGNYDYLGFHPYPAGAAVGPRSRFQRSIDDVRIALEGTGADPNRILVTETGVAAIGRVGVRRQARALTRMHARLSRMRDIAGVIYHRIVQPILLQDDEREIGYAWLKFGSSPLRPRPVYCAFVDAAERSYPGCSGRAVRRSR